MLGILRKLSLAWKIALILSCLSVFIFAPMYHGRGDLSLYMTATQSFKDNGHPYIAQGDIKSSTRIISEEQANRPVVAYPPLLFWVLQPALNINHSWYWTAIWFELGVISLIIIFWTCGLLNYNKAILLVFTPMVFLSILVGQVSAILTLFLVFAWKHKNNPFLCGALVGVAAAIKIYPALILIPLVQKNKSLRYFMLLCLGFTMVLSAGLLMPGIYPLQKYIELVVFNPLSGSFDLGNRYNVSLWGIVSRSIGGVSDTGAPLIHAPFWVSQAISLFIVLLMAWHTWRRPTALRWVTWIALSTPVFGCYQLILLLAAWKEGQSLWYRLGERKYLKIVRWILLILILFSFPLSYVVNNDFVGAMQLFHIPTVWSLLAVWFFAGRYAYADSAVETNRSIAIWREYETV